MKKNIIREKSFLFALKAIKLRQDLIEKKEFILSGQVMRSATSIGVNIEEALNGSSKRDFIYKMNIDYKEANESMYWLKLLDQSKILNVTEHLNEVHGIIKILTKILKTSRRE